LKSVRSTGRKLGDPVRGARAIITAVEGERTPMHLVIGTDALDLVRKKITNLQRTGQLGRHNPQHQFPGGFA